MSQRNTLARTSHDLGLAAWFGGSLMGAIGLNGAAAAAKEPSERLRLSSIGWARWAPFVVGSVGLHAVGSLGLIAGNKKRLDAQSGARSNTALKTIVTLAAAGTTLYSGLVGKKQSEHIGESVKGATDAYAANSTELEAVQKQQALLQWVTPALTAVLVALAAQQGEQQREVRTTR